MELNNYKIYKKPTVAKVIFQINFPNLFIIENRIGDFQVKIMDKFPESSLLIRRELLFANIGPDAKMEEIPIKENLGKKIWQFKSGEHIVLSITTNSLDIVSTQHKSYFSSETGEGFRDIIQIAVDNFLPLIPIAKIERIGLRYIDICPLPIENQESQIPSLENQAFLDWYNSALPLNRFDLADLGRMKFESELKFGDYHLIYKENLGFINPNKSEIQYTLDFDGYKRNIDSNHYLNVLDDIHILIHNEWEKTLKQPVKDLMEEVN